MTFILNDTAISAVVSLQIAGLAQDRQREIEHKAGEALYNSLADRPTDWTAGLIPSDKDFEIEVLAQEWLDMALIVAAANVRPDGSLYGEPSKPRSYFDDEMREHARRIAAHAESLGKAQSQAQAALGWRDI